MPLRHFRACVQASERYLDEKVARISIGSPPRLSSPVLIRSSQSERSIANSLQVGDEIEEQMSASTGPLLEVEEVCREVKASRERRMTALRALRAKADKAETNIHPIGESISAKEQELGEMKKELHAGKKRIGIIT